MQLGEPLELFEDYRSPAPVSALAARFYRGSTEPVALGAGERAPEIREAAPGAATVEAVRTTLHRLLVDEGVRPWQVVVLSGAVGVEERGLAAAAVRQRRALERGDR